MPVMFEQKPRPAALQLRRRKFAKERCRATQSMRELRRSARSWRLFDELGLFQRCLDATRPLARDGTDCRPSIKQQGQIQAFRRSMRKISSFLAQKSKNSRSQAGNAQGL